MFQSAASIKPDDRKEVSIPIKKGGAPESKFKWKVIMLEWSLLTMQAENVLPSLVPFQQPPLFNPQRNAPDAVTQKAQKIKPLKKCSCITVETLCDQDFEHKSLKYLHSENNHHQQILLPEPSGIHRLSHGKYPGA